MALLHDIDVESVLRDVFDGYSVIGHNDEVIACIGLTELPDGDGMGWAFFAEGIGTRFVEIHKCVVAWLSHCKNKNIYMTVKDEFAQGHRWAKMLGFKEVGIIPEYCSDDTNGTLYRRERM
jgi:hypothetical protein